MTTSPPSAAPASAARLVVEYAGFRRRLASLLYESLLGIGVLALGFLVPHLVLGVVLEFTPPGWFLWVHVFAILGVYFVWYWTRRGQTLAMQTWQLKVVSVEYGKEPDLKSALLRYCLAWPSVLLGGLGLMWALIDRDRQFLHDRLARTAIVLLPREKRR